MNKKTGLLVFTVFVLLFSSFIAYKIVDRPKFGETIASFTDCGCGGCGGEVSRVKEIEDKEEFEELKDKLAQPPSESACIAMGCSICTEYRLIET